MTASSEILLDKILATKSFQDFIEVARNFCLFIEMHQSNNEKEFLPAIQRHLISLYNLGFDLPKIDVSSDIDFDNDLPDNEMRVVLKFIADRVPFSYYWAVLNPIDNLNLAETGTGDLVDDLGDIYKDLKRELTTFDKGDFIYRQSAIWKFKFDFDNHWSEHCIEALHAIHHYLRENS